MSSDAHGYLDELQRYLVNDVIGADDYLKLKVFSTKRDRLPTYRVAFGNDTNPKTPWLQTDLQMYVPGKNGVDAFQKYALRKLKADFSDVPALWQLAQVLLGCLKIVWIPLDERKDDAQAIFESLNDTGMPLTALARQIKEHTGHWDMKAVRERSQKLAKEAIQIWASASV